MCLLTSTDRRGRSSVRGYSATVRAQMGAVRRTESSGPKSPYRHAAGGTERARGSMPLSSPTPTRGRFRRPSGAGARTTTLRLASVTPSDTEWIVVLAPVEGSMRVAGAGTGACGGDDVAGRSASRPGCSRRGRPCRPRPPRVPPCPALASSPDSWPRAAPGADPVRDGNTPVGTTAEGSSGTRLSRGRHQLRRRRRGLPRRLARRGATDSSTGCAAGGRSRRLPRPCWIARSPRTPRAASSVGPEARSADTRDLDRPVEGDR